MKIPRNIAIPEEISLLRRMNSLAGPKAINLGLGKPHVDTPRSIRELAAQAVREDKLEYTENAGDRGIRNLLALRLGLDDGEQLILTHGAQEALMAAMLATLSPGDEVLVPDPGFPAYATMVQMLRAKPVPYRLGLGTEGYFHDPVEIKKKLTAKTRMLVVSAPGNPTGASLGDAEATEILKIVSRKKMVILSDEVYGMLDFTQPYQPLALQSEQVISINAFSKSHAMTGWRIGYLAAQNAKLLHACLVAHQYIATCASVPAQRLLGRLLQAPGLFERIPHLLRIDFFNKRDLFLSHAGWLAAASPVTTGGFYLFPKIPEKNSLRYCERLVKQKNILLIPGVAFGKQGEGRVRISLAAKNEQLRKAARILADYSI